METGYRPEKLCERAEWPCRALGGSDPRTPSFRGIADKRHFTENEKVTQFHSLTRSAAGKSNHKWNTGGNFGERKRWNDRYHPKGYRHVWLRSRCIIQPLVGIVYGAIVFCDQSSDHPSQATATVAGGASTTTIGRGMRAARQAASGHLEPRRGTYSSCLCRSSSKQLRRVSVPALGG